MGLGIRTHQSPSAFFTTQAPSYIHTCAHTPQPPQRPILSRASEFCFASRRHCREGQSCLISGVPSQSTVTRTLHTARSPTVAWPTSCPRLARQALQLHYLPISGLPCFFWQLKNWNVLKPSWPKGVSLLNTPSLLLSLSHEFGGKLNAAPGRRQDLATKHTSQVTIKCTPGGLE